MKEIEIPLASTDKYEEALSKARFEYEKNPCASEGEKRLLEIIFPELRESDDERIREGLLRHFKNKTKPYWNEIAVKNIIAYLERQEEKPKNADSISADCASSAKCENAHNKPGDFVFELRQIISRHWHADMYGEYTDDEEGMAREILSLCERQNPAEWSEEDEKMLIGIVERGDSEIPRGECGLTPNQVAWLETRFKSLRPQPHWKPSEEQMEWLESAVKLSTDKPHIHGIIISLYEQLKRL